jgi:hypothetical protein
MKLPFCAEKYKVFQEKIFLFNQSIYPHFCQLIGRSFMPLRENPWDPQEIG